MTDKLRWAGLPVAVCLVSVLAGAGAASATVVVTESPGGAITASTGTSNLTVYGASGTVAMTCTTSTVTATLAANSGLAYPLPVAGASPLGSPPDSTTGNATISLNTCTVARIAVTVNCGAFNLANLLVTGSTSLRVTPVRVSGIRCNLGMVVGGMPCTATVGSRTSGLPGGVDARYTNNSNTLTINAPNGAPPTNQNLKVQSSGCPSTIPVGDAAFSGSGLAALVYTVSPAQTFAAS